MGSGPFSEQTMVPTTGYMTRISVVMRFAGLCLFFFLSIIYSYAFFEGKAVSCAK